ncbi:Hsp70 family protein [Pseudovibrio sp. Tun.PSC04-5.I4]|uniref:Hsp70 family protein n=1 Tax=Pseudovibrio sp. Tun.PSC04-5.I4 TaxID=1798213 RepID=UPI000888695C|nr:Hsp70 family protein [Pseudovibrio sp. Tun.PSC04-5.I4]SDQ16743.1 hypothetical chaperone protein [Pseudovibrio sp. Tun.PSC04-5.I4]
MSIAYAGIDFGTSNSTVGVFSGALPELINLDQGNPEMPSAIFFNFEDEQIVYGRQAKQEYIRGDEGRLMQALKSILGTSLIQEKTAVMGGRMAFRDIIALYLRQLKHKLDAHLNEDVTKVVLGRPVHFIDGNETADKAAQDTLESIARQEGFKDIAFQYEPIAAALAYEQTVAQEELILVLDIGGGTADFSIIRVSPDRRNAPDRSNDILANTGVHIGGTDFDRLLSMAQVMPQLGYKTLTKCGKRALPSKYYFDLATWQFINQLYAPNILRELSEVRREAAQPHLVERLREVIRAKDGHALATRVEQAKIDLSSADIATVKIELEEEDVLLEMSTTEFRAAIDASICKIEQTINEALSNAGVTGDQINSMFLTGGTTRIPLLRRHFQELLPNATIVEGDVFGAVGLGLAADARRKFA